MPYKEGEEEQGFHGNQHNPKITNQIDFQNSEPYIKTQTFNIIRLFQVLPNQISMYLIHLNECTGIVRIKLRNITETTTKNMSTVPQIVPIEPTSLLFNTYEAFVKEEVVYISMTGQMF